MGGMPPGGGAVPLQEGGSNGFDGYILNCQFLGFVSDINLFSEDVCGLLISDIYLVIDDCVHFCVCSRQLLMLETNSRNAFKYISLASPQTVHMFIKYATRMFLQGSPPLADRVTPERPPTM